MYLAGHQVSLYQSQRKMMKFIVNFVCLPPLSTMGAEGNMQPPISDSSSACRFLEQFVHIHTIFVLCMLLGYWWQKLHIRLILCSVTCQSQADTTHVRAACRKLSLPSVHISAMALWVSRAYTHWSGKTLPFYLHMN